MENYPSKTQTSNSDVLQQFGAGHRGPPPPYTQNPDMNPSYYPDSMHKGNIGPGPAVVVTAPIETTVQHRDYLNAALAAMAFFFIPTGIAATIFAYKANKRYKAGDVIEAERLNRYARNLIIASVILGVMCYVVIIIIRIRYASYSSY